MLAATLTAAAAVVLQPPTAAQAAPEIEPQTPAVVTPLPVPPGGDVVATRDRVFVSGGRTSTSVAITNPSGVLTGSLDDLPGPSDLLLSNDLSTLYVALPTANAIAAFDANSLREVARYATGQGECPNSLTLSGRRLFFGYGCGNWGGNIGVVELASRPATVKVALVAEQFYNLPLLAAPAGNRSVLLAAQPALSPASVQVFSVAADSTLTFVDRSPHTALGGNLRDIAVERAGWTMYLAMGGTYHIPAFPVDDMSEPSRVYELTPYANAVELSRTGAYLAAGSRAGSAPDVYVYHVDGTPVVQYQLDADLLSGGLAWAPNGRRLYAITTDWREEKATLNVLTLPTS